MIYKSIFIYIITININNDKYKMIHLTKFHPFIL